MDTELLGHLKSGEPVYERYEYHHNPIPDSVMDLIKKEIFNISSENRGIIAKEFTYDYFIGETLCVNTTEKDEVYYARKYGSKKWFRFAKNRVPESSKSLTIILCISTTGQEYILLHRFIGNKGETNPSIDSKDFHDDISNYIKAVDYWNSHAFIDGSKKINSATITTDCPWWYKKTDT